MKIAIACDHAGFELKEEIKKYLLEMQHEVTDFGTKSSESVDYPDFAHPLALSISNEENSFGISVCGSGNGINMVVNKYDRIRAALCWNSTISELARSHNDANVCSLPARFISVADALEVVKVFLSTSFEGGRHLRRVKKMPAQTS